MDANRQLAILFGVAAAILAAWISVALKTGKTIWLSRMSMPRIVSRSDPNLGPRMGYWSMIACLSALCVASVATAVWHAISN
jgi:hypothetical protein